MKCGICGTDRMNVYGSDRETILRQRVMRHASDVWTHKHEMHKEEMKASSAKATERRKEKEQAERDAEAQRKLLRAAVSQAAIQPFARSWTRDKEIEYSLTTTAEMHISAGAQDRGLPARYPEAEILDMYHATKARIAELETECEDMLKRAWEAGTNISEADIDAVQAAGEVIV